MATTSCARAAASRTMVSSRAKASPPMASAPTRPTHGRSRFPPTACASRSTSTLAGNEARRGNEQLVVQGKRGPALDKIFKLRDKLELEGDQPGRRALELGPAGDAADRHLPAGQHADAGRPRRAVSAPTSTTGSTRSTRACAHWGEIGLAFTSALFDPQAGATCRTRWAPRVGADTLDNTLRADAEDNVGHDRRAADELDDPNGDRLDQRLLHQQPPAADGRPAGRARRAARRAAVGRQLPRSRARAARRAVQPDRVGGERRQGLRQGLHQGADRGALRLQLRDARVPHPDSTTRWTWRASRSAAR